MRTLGCVGEEVTRRLVALQGTRNGGEMAAILGCSRVYYVQLKAGRRRMSYSMAKKAAQAFPEIMALLMRDLLEAS